MIYTKRRYININLLTLERIYIYIQRSTLIKDNFQDHGNHVCEKYFKYTITTFRKSQILIFKVRNSPSLIFTTEINRNQQLGIL